METITKTAASAWRDSILQLANRYYEDGHAFEQSAVQAGEDSKSAERWWVRAECCQQIYSELCSLIASVDPRPGGPNAPAKPW